MTLKKLLKDVGECSNKTIANKFDEIYNSSKKYSLSIEVEIEQAVFGKKQNWFTEVTSSQLRKHLGSEKIKAFQVALKRSGWSTRYRLDAFSPIPLTFVELKVSKLDKIWGERGGTCLWDIGPWAKDIIRLQLLQNVYPNSKCYFILIGLYRDLTVANPKYLFHQKLKNEFNNDIARGKNSELSENYIYRKKQKLILEKLISINISKVLTMEWKHILAIGIDVKVLS